MPGEKILIVEDEEKLARFLELELVHEGYTVDKAWTGGWDWNSRRTADTTLSCWT